MNNPNIKSIAESVASIAQRNEISEYTERIKENVLDYLEKSELVVPFLGEFSVGKSSVINKVIGEKLLPLDIKPTTSIVTELRYGNKAFMLQSESGVREISESEFREIASGKSPCGENDILAVKHSSDFLSGNICIVDTPGVNSMVDQHSDITYGYLPRADAAFVVLDANQGEIPRTVVDFLQNQLLMQTASKLIFVVNKIDDVPEEERESLIKKFSKTINQIIPDARVIPATADPEIPESELEEPGVSLIKKAIKEDILAAKREIMYSRSKKKLSLTCGEMVSMLESTRAGLESTSEELDEKLKNIKNEKIEITRKLEKLNRNVAESMSSIEQDAKEAILRIISGVANKAESEILSTGKFSEGFALDLQQKIKGWIARDLEAYINGELREKIEEASQDIDGDIKEIASSVPEINIGDISSGDNVIVDVLIEGALIVLLNVVLPGEWVVALLGRVIGGKALNKVSDPIKDMIKNLVSQVIGDSIKSKLVSQVRNSITALEPEITSQLSTQLRKVESDLDKQLDAYFQDLLDKHEQALEKAKREIKKDESHRHSLIEALDSDIAELNRVVKTL